MVLGSGKNKPETGVRLLFSFFDIAPSVLRSSFANVVALMVINRLISPNQLIFQFKAKQFIVEIFSFFNRKTNCTRIPSIIYSRDNVYNAFKSDPQYFFFWNEVPYRGLGAEKLSAGG